MKEGMAKLSIVLLVTVVLAGACGSAAPPAPTAEATATPGQPVQIVTPQQARDAALTYLVDAYGAKAPPPGLVWTEQETTPPGVVGQSSYEYVSGEWVIDLTYPVTAPESLLYQIEVSNPRAGFDWTGIVNAAGEVLAPDKGTIHAVDLALAYMQKQHGQQLPGVALGWSEQDTTPQGSQTEQDYQFTSGDWTILVSYPLSTTQSPLYSIEILNQITGFDWVGAVDSAGAVSEISFSGGEVTPTP